MKLLTMQILTDFMKKISEKPDVVKTPRTLRVHKKIQSECFKHFSANLSIFCTIWGKISGAFLTIALNESGGTF